MKKQLPALLVCPIAIVLMSVPAAAQTTARMSNTHFHVLQHQPSRRATPPTAQAFGDTVFVFDGAYVYDWNSTLPGTFNLQTEDIDGLTVNSAYTAYFGNTVSYVTFYDTVANSNLHYAHPDTVYTQATTSWFTSPGQSDDWLEMGPIHIPSAGATLHWSHNYPDGGFRDGYEVFASTSGITSTNFTGMPLDSIADNDPSTVADTVETPHPLYYQRSVNIDAYAGQDVYIAFRHYANDQDLLFLTNVVITEDSLAAGIKNNTGNLGMLSAVPNPATNTAFINYSLKNSGNVQLHIYNLEGQEMYSENQPGQSAGEHLFRVNVADMAAGVYYYSLTVNGDRKTGKLVVTH